MSKEEANKARFLQLAKEADLKQQMQMAQLAALSRLSASVDASLDVLCDHAGEKLTVSLAVAVGTAVRGNVPLEELLNGVRQDYAAKSEQWAKIQADSAPSQAPLIQTQ